MSRTLEGERPLIKNSLVEGMFLRIADDREVTIFKAMAEQGATHRATALASRKVAPLFNWLVERFEQEHGDGSIEAVKRIVYRRSK